MAKRISELTNTLKQIGEIQVTDWDLIDVLNKDIDLGASLRKLGNLKVMEWDFESAMPEVHKFANQEIDLPKFVRKVAQIKVLDWDFRRSPKNNDPPPPKKTPKLAKKHLSPDEMQDLISRLRIFLQYIVVNLIHEPNRAEIRIQEIETNVLRFKLLVAQRDVKDLIGRDGVTASSIRNLLKTTAASEGVHVLLEILSHEEELAATCSHPKTGLREDPL